MRQFHPGTNAWTPLSINAAIIAPAAQKMQAAANDFYSFSKLAAGAARAFWQRQRKFAAALTKRENTPIIILFATAMALGTKGYPAPFFC